MTPENFLKVLAGDVKGLKGIGSGKALLSGPDDHVFINFVDHGAPGLLAFPNSELHARTLQDTLLDMYHKNRYDKLVMYIEACESGSMFEDLLPDNLNSKFDKIISVSLMLIFTFLHSSFCNNSFKPTRTFVCLLLRRSSWHLFR